MTLAASVLPTPASPSMKSGFCSLRARKMDVASARSPMYLRSRRRRSTSSMVGGALTVDKAYEVARPDWPGHPESLLTSFGLVDGPLGQDARKVLLVLRAGPQVAGWAEAVRRMLGRLFRFGALVQRLLAGGRPDGASDDGGGAHPPVTADLRRCHPDHRPLE